MKGLEYYIKQESRAVNDVVGFRSIYNDICNKQEEFGDEYIKMWESRLRAAEMRLEICRKQLKSYIENKILTD